MSTGFGSERQVVQAPLIRYAGEVGWTYIPTSEALSLRKGEGGLPEFHQILSGLSRNQIYGLLASLKKEGRVRVVGKTKGSYWELES